MLHKSSFPSIYLQWTFSAAEFVLRPTLWCINQIASIFLRTSVEKSRAIKHVVFAVPTLAVYLCLFSCLSVPALLAFIVRCVLHIFKHPYTLSTVMNTMKVDHCFIKKQLEFNITTSNVCLLPEFLSRFNNLSDTGTRAKRIGERVIADQLRLSITLPNSEIHVYNIDTHFPKIDFLCLQEAWDRDYCKVLIGELHHVFPWILYDVGQTNFRNNYFILNSGLLFASRFEILDASFKTYTHSCKQCLFSGKGLLMVKVQLWKSDTQSAVGYIFNTHLQAYQGETSVIQFQLDDVLSWTEKFREQTTSSLDIVLFDILCGDFNFDNMSPGERLLSNHRLFSVYVDYGRKCTGRDKPWTIGTEMRQAYLWEDEISSPEKMKKAMLNSSTRRRYILDADIELPTMGNIVKAEPKTGEVDEDIHGKRRIDYILYRKDCHIGIQSYKFVTRLAGLTDHIPVSMNCVVNDSLQE